MTTLNKDQTLRDKLLDSYFGDKEYRGGIRNFDNLDVVALTTMLDMKFADPDECQNCSPSIRDFHNFMIIHPNVTAHGYVVCSERPDYRLTIEGLFCEGELTDKLIADFIKFCNGCDELTVNDNTLRSWWD